MPEDYVDSMVGAFVEQVPVRESGADPLVETIARRIHRNLFPTHARNDRAAEEDWNRRPEGDRNLMRAAAAGFLDLIRGAGRLLPWGGETRTEWKVLWHGDDGDSIRNYQHHVATREDADVLGAQKVGKYGITRYSVHRRDHRIFDDGSAWVGPWVAVDPEEEPNA